MKLIKYYGSKGWFWQLTVACFTLTSMMFYAMTYAADNKQNLLKARDSNYKEDVEQLQKIAKKYEELSWFVTKPGHKKGPKVCSDTPSTVLYGQFYPYFDRSIMMLKTMHIFYSGEYDDYLEFTSLQSKEDRLTWDQFLDIKSYISGMVKNSRVLSEAEIVELVEFVVVVSEMGKSEIARNKAWIYEITEEDDLQFVRKVLTEHPEIFPSYLKLNEKQRSFIMHLIDPVPFEQLIHLEGGEELFSRISTEDIYTKYPELLEYGLYASLCRFAGKYGEISPCSSSVFTASLFESVQFLRSATQIALSEGATNAFAFYLQKRAECLGFDPGSPLNRALTKIGVSLSLHKVSDGRLLKEAFLKLGPEDLSLVLSECNSQLAGKTSSSIAFADFLHETAQKSVLGNCFRDRLFHTVEYVLPFYARVIKDYHARQEKNEIAVNSPLNFQEIVPHANFDPSILKVTKFSIDEEGTISLL